MGLLRRRNTDYFFARRLATNYRGRSAFPHIDARERFGRREIWAADVVGQKPMSKELS